jgi:hypothetical protein
MNDCPLYVIEGAGGNNGQVEVTRNCNFLNYLDQNLNFTATYVDNTGYGVLTLFAHPKSSGLYHTKIFYEHISMLDETVAADSFQLISPLKSFSSVFSTAKISIVVVFGTITLVAIIFMIKNAIQKGRSSKVS